MRSSPSPAAQDFWSVGFEAPASLIPWLAAVCLRSASLKAISVLAGAGWSAPSNLTTRVLAAVGQRVLLGAGLALALLVTLAPSAMLVGAAIGGQNRLDLPFVARELPMLGVLAAASPEGAALILIPSSGLLWDRLDPSAEILT